MNAGLNIAFPLGIGEDGRTNTATLRAHVTDLVEQLIFTSPGERVNRPDYGGGVLQVVFAPNSIELQATMQFTLLAALQRYLGDLIDIDALDIEIEDERFTLALAYRLVRSGERVLARFGPFTS